MSNFSMETILGKGFSQAQVHTVYSTSAKVSYIEMQFSHFISFKTIIAVNPNDNRTPLSFELID